MSIDLKKLLSIYELHDRLMIELHEIRLLNSCQVKNVFNRMKFIDFPALDHYKFKCHYEWVKPNVSFIMKPKNIRIQEFLNNCPSNNNVFYNTFETYKCMCLDENDEIITFNKNNLF